MWYGVQNMSKDDINIKEQPLDKKKFDFCRGDHIVPNFAELWPGNNPNIGKKKKYGIDYYMSALQHHGLSGHLPQPDNFTTCGKQPIEIAQYNSPIEVD